MSSKADESFTDAKKRLSKARKGKRAETVVEEVLKTLKDTSPALDYDRLPDTRSAGRIMPARVSDFSILYCGKTTSLEIKEVKKGGRINIKSAFPQYPRMLRRNMAGASGFVLVKSLEKGLWYLVDVQNIPKKVKSFSFIDIGEASNDHAELIKGAIGWR